MDKVKQLDVKKDMKVSELIEQFDQSGVLGSGRVARASNILCDMIKDEEMSVFMSLGGPLIPGGLRNIVTDMIRNKHVNLIISSGANITHDMLEAFGGSHYRDEGRDDEDLNAEGIGRIADINVGSDDFTKFESEIIKIFEDISARKPKISIQELLYEVGLLIDDENYEKAYEMLTNMYDKMKEDAEYLEKIALLAKMMEKEEDAAKYWEELVVVNPNSLVAYSELLDIYNNKDKYKYYITRAKYKILNEKVSQSIDDYKKASL